MLLKFNVIDNFLLKEEPLLIIKEAIVHRKLNFTIGVLIIKIFSLLLIVIN